MTTTDLIIIGAGPAGLFAGFYAGMRELTVEIIDSLEGPGGQPQALYPQKVIYDIGGYPKITGSELTKALTEQISTFSETTTFHFNEQVLSFKKKDHHFQVQTDKGQNYQSRALLLATGGGSFEPRKIHFNHSEEYLGRGLTYRLTDLDQYQGKDVVVCGGGDSAIDAVLNLAPIAHQITLVHRRKQFRAHEANVQKVQNLPNVKILAPYTPCQIDGNGDQATSLTLTKGRSDEKLTLPVDEVIIAYGFLSSGRQTLLDPFKKSKDYLQVDQYLRTSIDGIFALGDIVTYPGKTQLIASAFGEGPTAINAVAHYLHPNNKATKSHSSPSFQ